MIFKLKKQSVTNSMGQLALLPSPSLLSPVLPTVAHVAHAAAAAAAHAAAHAQTAVEQPAE